jgi:hypothetical protein
VALLVPTTASGVLRFSEQGTLCGWRTWRWAVRHHAAFDTLAKPLQEFWNRRPIDLDSDGVIVCRHPRWKAAVKLGLARVPVHVARDQAVETTRILTRHQWKRYATGGILGDWRAGRFASRPVGGGVAGADGCRPAGRGQTGGAIGGGGTERAGGQRLIGTGEELEMGQVSGMALSAALCGVVGNSRPEIRLERSPFVLGDSVRYANW